jgi:oligopeptide transport system permease protein
VGAAAALGRLGRSDILDNLTGEHIRAANARGLPRRRVVAHVLKNSLVPIVTIFGLDLAYLMGARSSPSRSSTSRAWDRR